MRIHKDLMAAVVVYALMVLTVLGFLIGVVVGSMRRWL